MSRESKQMESVPHRASLSLSHRLMNMKKSNNVGLRHCEQGDVLCSSLRPVFFVFMLCAYSSRQLTTCGVSDTAV